MICLKSFKYSEGPTDSIFSGLLAAVSRSTQELGLVFSNVLFKLTKGPQASQTLACVCQWVRQQVWLPSLLSGMKVAILFSSETFRVHWDKVGSAYHVSQRCSASHCTCSGRPSTLNKLLCWQKPRPLFSSEVCSYAHLELFGIESCCSDSPIYHIVKIHYSRAILLPWVTCLVLQFNIKFGLVSLEKPGRAWGRGLWDAPPPASLLLGFPFSAATLPPLCQCSAWRLGRREPLPSSVLSVTEKTHLLLKPGTRARHL